MTIHGTLAGQYSISAGELHDPLGSVRVGVLQLLANTAAAYSIQNSTGTQLVQIDTTTGSVAFAFGNATDNPLFSFAGSGRMVLGSGLYDAAASTAITIGGTNATVVNLGRAAITTQVIGPMLWGHRQIFGNIISPMTLSANQNNYSPTSFTATSVIRQDATGPFNITGWAAPSPSEQREFRFVNISSSTITFTHSDAASSAGNRILCPGAANVAVRTFGCVIFQYDITTTAWRIIGGLI